MPTKVGMHGFFARITATAWMPACAGMTMRGRHLRLNLLF
jgi:hypothetical protein